MTAGTPHHLLFPKVCLPISLDAGIPIAVIGMARMNAQMTPKFELSREDALRYLRREAVAPADASLRGYALATYQGFPLGFAKALAGRANNLYPKEWRIRTDYLQNT